MRLLSNKIPEKVQDGLKLFKLFSLSDGEVARGQVIRQKDLFDSLERELNLT